MHSTALNETTNTAAGAIGCKNFQSKVFDSMYSYLESEKETPSLIDLNQYISAHIDKLAAEQKITDDAQLAQLKTEFAKVFDILVEQSKNAKGVQTVKEHIQTLIELEMQDQSTAANVKLNSQLAQQFGKVKAISRALNIACVGAGGTAEPEAASGSSGQPGGTVGGGNVVKVPVAAKAARMMAGMNNVISTAYQSCQSMEIAPITAATPSVSGISRLADNHADGVGGRRIVSSLPSVQNSHPYVKVAGNSTAAGCFNVYKNPLIYDYGGEPSVANNTLNFTKNAGTGTSVLGVDCSALVSAAAAAGGLRYKPNVENKAIFIRQSSGKFINAETSGFTCYKNITLTASSTIKPGDIAAVNGHVVMVDTMGLDPFGLKKISNLAGCDDLSHKNFDFVVAQSSPSKNGIGINRYVARDYLGESGSMRKLFVEMGKSACRAAFQNTSITPKSSSWGIIRHKGTAECMAPVIQMAGQSCVSQCQM